jgi:hypothetical protein
MINARKYLRLVLVLVLFLILFAITTTALARNAGRLMALANIWLKGTGLMSEKITNALSLGTLDATIAYLIITVTIAVVAVRELNHLQSASRADFFLRLTREFFTKKAQRITDLCASDCLTYVPAGKTKDAYFSVDQEKVRATPKHETMKEQLVKKPLYSCFEIDDAVMGPLDDVRRLTEDGVLDKDTVDAVFGYYFRAVWNNSAIEKYRTALLQEHREYTKMPKFMEWLNERQKGMAL